MSEHGMVVLMSQKIAGNKLASQRISYIANSLRTQPTCLLQYMRRRESCRVISIDF